MNHFSSMNKSTGALRTSAFLLATLFLSGCKTTDFASILETSNSKKWHSLYLRGVFTWWEADEKYKVKQVSNTLYKTSVELIADGQPYDFKFADKDWTPGTRCGFFNKASDEILSEGKRVKANCDTPGDNFKFTPSTTGLYHFYFDVSEETPTIFIEKA